MRRLKHRALRCAHGFYAGLCTERTCPHWDGVRSQKDAQRTIVHDAWGKNEPPRHEEQDAERQR
jgi:hypothetical protein